MAEPAPLGSPWAQIRKSMYFARPWLLRQGGELLASMMKLVQSGRGCDCESSEKPKKKKDLVRRGCFSSSPSNTGSLRFHDAWVSGEAEGQRLDAPCYVYFSEGG